MYILCTIYEISDDRYAKKNLLECVNLKCNRFQKILRISTYKSELLWSHSVMVVLVMTDFFLFKNKLKLFWRLKYFTLTIVVLLVWPQKNQNGINKTTIIWFFWTQNTFWFFWQQYYCCYATNYIDQFIENIIVMVKVFEKTKNYCEKWVELNSSKYPKKDGTFWKSKKSEKLLKIPIFYGWIQNPETMSITTTLFILLLISCVTTILKSHVVLS